MEWTMSPSLHAHLKRGLGCDDLYAETDDDIEHVPLECRTTGHQVAKRQRIEEIAAKYLLHGRLPVLLTASLRGPFDDGWRNPWAEANKAKRRSLDKQHGAGSNKTRGKGPDDRRKVRAVQVQRRTRSAAKEMVEERGVASPETSRALITRAADLHERHTPEEVEVPPATAPEPEEKDTSDVFSLETARCLRSGSPMTDPFWLRKPESEGQFDMRKSTNGTSELSPTRSRGNIPPPDRRRTLQLAVPKAPVGLTSFPTASASPDDAPSCASASMVMASPVKPAVPVDNHEAPSSDLERPNYKPASVQKSASTREPQPAQAHSLNTSHPSAAPLTAQKVPTAHSVPRLHGPASEHTRQSSFSQPGNGEASHDAASRPPESSSGFVYKKVGSTKWTISNAPRSKPRAVNFNSSPAHKKIFTASSKSGTQVGKSAEKDTPQTTADASKVAPRPHERTQGSQADETVHDGQRTGSTRHSTMSTQAAMLLAQLEFQESTFPRSSFETPPRPWSQPPEETRRPMMPEPSPAMTPFSVFSPQLGQAQPAASVLRGPPISTQDLFAAASPFAFSTVKKKPEVAQRSNLRMSMTSLDGHDDGGFAASPIGPCWFPDGMPVNEKKIVPSPWKFSFDKEARKSQESVVGSLDSHGPNDSLHFTDGPNGTLNDA